MAICAPLLDAGSRMFDELGLRDQLPQVRQLVDVLGALPNTDG